MKTIVLVNVEDYDNALDLMNENNIDYDITRNPWEYAIENELNFWKENVRIVMDTSESCFETIENISDEDISKIVKEISEDEDLITHLNKLIEDKLSEYAMK